MLKLVYNILPQMLNLILYNFIKAMFKYLIMVTIQTVHVMKLLINIEIVVKHQYHN